MTNCSTIEFPSSLVTLRHYACSDCGFREVSSEYIINISQWSFGNCTSLRKVYLPNAVSSYYGQWSQTFSGCSSLNDITLGEEPTVTTLNETFKNCTSLTASSFKRTITLVRNMTSCDSTFYGCTALTSLPPIIIPNMVGAVTSMFNRAGLTGVVDLRDIFGETCNATACNSLVYNCNQIGKLYLPELPNCTTLASFFETTSTITSTNNVTTEIGDIYAPVCTNIDRWLCNSATKSALIKVGNVTLGAVSSADHAYFERCPNLEEIGDVDLSSALTATGLFNGCSHLATIGHLSISSSCTNIS